MYFYFFVYYCSLYIMLIFEFAIWINILGRFVGLFKRGILGVYLGFLNNIDSW